LKASIFLSFCLILAQSYAAASGDSERNAFESDECVKILTFESLNLPYQAISSLHGGIKLSRTFPTWNEDLFISMRDLHPAVFSGDARVDAGTLYLTPSTIKYGNDVVPDGLLLRIQNVGRTRLDNMQERLANKKPFYSLNCISGICNVLNEDANLRISGGILTQVLPTNFLVGILKNGLVDESGQIHTATLYVVGSEDADTLLQKYKKSQIETLRLAGGTIGLGLANFILWTFFNPT
jgi:hypothetical protein